jgi:hypothetical protein
MYKISSIAALLSLILLVGCTKYPDLDDSERQKDVSITYYDNTSDFGSYQTFSIVDTVGFIENEGDSIYVEPSKRSERIKNKIISRLTAAGYEQVDTSANPDLIVNAHLISLNIQYSGYVGGYWDMGYYYGYDPFYYGSPYYWGYSGYSYYYPYGYAYSYSSTFGSLLMEIIDRKNRNENTEQLKVIWSGIVAGALNTSSEINSRIDSGIDECFDQSTYLYR